MRYRVAPPQGWQQMRLHDVDMAWTSPALSSSLLVNSHCKKSDDAPLKVLTNHLLFGTTERTFLSQNETTISRRAALLSEVSTKLDGVERRLLLLVLKKDGCVYDVVLDSSPANIEDARPAFDAMVKSFDVLPRGDA